MVGAALNAHLALVWQGGTGQQTRKSAISREAYLLLPGEQGAPPWLTSSTSNAPLHTAFCPVFLPLAEDPVRRYNLGEFKEELMSAMGLNTEGEGSAMAFLRRGYKVRRRPPIHRLSREVGLLACWCLVQPGWTCGIPKAKGCDVGWHGYE